MQKLIFKYEKIIVFFLLIIEVFIVFISFLQLRDNYPFFIIPPKGTDMLTNLNEALGIFNNTFPGNNPYTRIFLYSYFLYAFLWFSGKKILLARLIQAMIIPFLGYFIYLSSKKITNNTNASIITLLLFTLYMPFYAYSFFFLDTIVHTFLFILTLYTWILLYKKRTLIKIFLSAFITSLFILIRPNTLILIPFMFLLFLKDFKRKKIKSTIIFYIILFFFLSLPAIRNYLLVKEFKLIVGSSRTLWIGNNPQATGGMFFGNRWRELNRLSKKEGDRVYFKDILNFIFKSPHKFILLKLKKIYLFFSSYEYPNNLNLYEIANYSNILSLLPVGFYIIGPMGMVGFLMYFQKKKNIRLGLLIALLSVGYIISVIIFFVISRFRLPVIPVFLIFSGYFIVEFFKMSKKFKKKAVFLLIIFTIFVNFQYLKNIYLKILPSKVVRVDYGWIIMDDNNIWRARKVVKFKDGLEVKKIFYVTKRTPFIFLRLCFITYNNIIPEYLNVDINRKKLKLKTADFKIMKKSNNSNFCYADFIIKEGIIKNGKNSIIIYESENILIPYDDSVDLGRSFYIYNGLEKKIPGELMIRLVMAIRPVL